MDFADLATGPPPQLPLAAFRRRRRELARRLGDGQALVVATHPTRPFSHDVDHPFRPHSDFWYLTGFDEPGAVLALEGGSGRSTLFLRDRRPEAEIWTGTRLGVARARSALGVDAAHPIGELRSRLGGILGGLRVHAIADHDPPVRRRIRAAAGARWVPDDKGETARPGGPPQGIRRPSPHPPHGRRLVHEMRLVKDAAELRMLQRACGLGVAAHLEAAQAVRPGRREYEAEAAFAHHARRHGSNGVGYPSICGCGPNAAVLHHVRNQGTLRAGQLFLIDAGCAWGHYTSDITRTYPVGGRFTRLQEDLYGLVQGAHRAAMRKVRPGNPFGAPHQAAVEVLAAGLLDLGILEGSFEAAVKTRAYRRHFMHGTSHFLGLDVHDAGSATEADGSPRRLRPGMVLTVEPGLYFNSDFAPGTPRRLRGIGIRIEDDVAVTASGRRLLSRGLPSGLDEVAALVPRVLR